MVTLIRYTLIALGTLLALLLIATVAILLLVDPEDYRDEIVAALSEETGRAISLEGELGLSVLPCCSLQLGPLAVGNPRGWPDAEFLRAENVALSVQLWPLLTRGELQVGQVSLDGLQLNLISRRDGSVNWEFAGASDADTVETDGPGDAPPALAVEGIRVSDARLSYVDQQTNERIELQDLQFATGAITPDRPADVSLSLVAVGLLPGQPVRLQLSGEAVLGADGKRAELNNLNVRLDDTTIRGQLRLTDPDTAAVEFALAVDRFDADRYLGDSETTDAQGAAAENINATPVDIPVQTLRDLRLNGNLSIAELIFSGAQLRDVAVTVGAADGVLRLHPLTAALYDGSYAGDVRLDVRGARPKLAVNEQLKGITLAALLTDTRGAANLSGSGNVSIKASASGTTVGELLERLSGDASFELSDGIYKGIDLWYEIRKARALLKKTAAPDKPATLQTELSEFSGTLQFAGGQVQNRDFKAAVPFMRLTGSGSYNLLNEAMDYTLQARVVETPTFADAQNQTEELDKLQGLTLPVRVTGTASNPKVKIELGDMVKDAAKDAARDAVKDKVRDRLQKKFNLFN